MKVLCVCNGAHVRSVTLARLLRKRGLEVLTCGVNNGFSDGTIAMLFEWADVIYIQHDSLEKFDRRFRFEPEGAVRPPLWARAAREKMSLAFDVGPDDWKVPQHPNLLSRLRDKIEWYEGQRLFPPMPTAALPNLVQR